jgi:hypothetical protein
MGGVCFRIACKVGTPWIYARRRKRSDNVLHFQSIVGMQFIDPLRESSYHLPNISIHVILQIFLIKPLQILAVLP